MLAHVRAQRNVEKPGHFFIHGSRGLGKTTILLALAHKIAESPGLSEAFDVALYAEEERPGEGSCPVPLHPRLLVFLYDCLGERRLPDLVVIVQRIVDALTPMYQDVIYRLLNRGQKAVLHALASRGGGRVGGVAALTFQTIGSVRAFLNDLPRSKL